MRTPKRDRKKDEKKSVKIRYDIVDRVLGFRRLPTPEKEDPTNRGVKEKG